MKSFILGIAFMLLSFVNAEAQGDTLKQFNFYAGGGYFGVIIQFIDPGFNEPSYVKINPDVLGKIYNGQSIWLRFGYKFKTDFILSCYLSLAKTKQKYNDALGLYWDEYLTDNYSFIDLMIMKELNHKNNYFSFGTGVLFRDYHHPDISYDITPIYNAENEVIDVEIGLPHPINLKMKDLGVVFDFEYYYRFKNNLSIGVSCSTNLIFDIGFETIQISPLIGIVF
jgi:hypothetical protein